MSAEQVLPRSVSQGGAELQVAQHLEGEATRRELERGAGDDAGGRWATLPASDVASEPCDVSAAESASSAGVGFEARVGERVAEREPASEPALTSTSSTAEGAELGGCTASRYTAPRVPLDARCVVPLCDR